MNAFASTPCVLLPRTRALATRIGLAVIVGFTIFAAGFPGSGSASLSEQLVPSSGAHFGVFSGPPRAGRAWGQEMPYLERLVGRRFDLDRWYQRWDEPFPGKPQRDAVAAGRIPVIGWNAVSESGAPVPWSEIAAGGQDATIEARADELKVFGHKVMLIFNHEPEDDLSTNGTPADFRAAFRRVASVMRARGATNVVFVWTMMADTFNPAGRDPGDYYPGDDVVDWVAADGYNWSGSDYVSGPWREFSEIFDSFNRWATRKGKPAMVAETGVLEDSSDPRRKARWLTRARETVKRWPRMKAVIYFQGQGWQFDSSAPATAAYRAMGADPCFNPRAGGSNALGNRAGETGAHARRGRRAKRRNGSKSGRACNARGKPSRRAQRRRAQRRALSPARGQRARVRRDARRPVDAARLRVGGLRAGWLRASLLRAARLPRPAY